MLASGLEWLYGVVDHVPGRTNGLITRAPTRPPPRPVIPGSGEFGPGPSPQKASESDWGPSDSSKVMTRTPSLTVAGDEVIRGIHCFSHASALTSPPGCPSTLAASRASWQ